MFCEFATYPLPHCQGQGPWLPIFFELPWYPGLDAKISLGKRAEQRKEEMQFILNLDYRIPSTFQDVVSSYPTSEQLFWTTPAGSEQPHFQNTHFKNTHFREKNFSAGL